MNLEFWAFGGGLGVIGAFTNRLDILLLSALAIIAYGNRFGKVKG